MVLVLVSCHDMDWPVVLTTQYLPEALGRKRLDELPKKSLGNATTDADVDRRSTRGIEVCPENLVPQDKVLTVVRIPFGKHL
jgi:hypothetical protein